MSDLTSPSVELDIVICTYNRSASLEHTLDALARQRGADPGAWSVLVVDNNSTDGTPDILDRWAASGRLPAMRWVTESRQGLTHARLRGVRETAGEWIAFVDDDCIVSSGWVAEALAFSRERPRCGAFGSRVVLEWGREPMEVLRRYGWAFAEQDLGDEPRLVDGIAGAGMVVRRAALRASGWTDKPLLEDRVGDRVVSGGDVEIIARVAGQGWELWYAPRCALRHVIPASRATRRRVLALTNGLGACSAHLEALWWTGGRFRFLGRALTGDFPGPLRIARSAVGAVVRRRDPAGPAFDAAFVAGRIRGVVSIVAAASERRRELFGAARRGSRS
jgi:GT2 family glycosyltransferase